MRKYFCDICNKEFDYDYIIENNCFNLDICKDCSKKIEKYIKELKKEVKQNFKEM